MAELDYAFLAEYARVDPAGTLTAVGASFTHVVARIPTTQLVSVAGRVRTHMDAPSAPLEIQWTVPGGAYVLTLNLELIVGATARPYGEGRVGLLFAATSVIPLVAEGLYSAVVKLEGDEVRRLAFEVSLPDS